MDKHWKKEEIETFFDTCFSYFYWRSLGLLGAFVYELGQKQEDLRNLEWDALDESLTTVVVKGLSLPISKNLKTMLEQHKEEFDFQKYLFPYYRKQDGSYRPLNKKLVEYHLKQVRQKSGLDPALNLNGLRWTSLVQMYKDGVSRQELMCLTGIDEGAKLDKALGQEELTLQGN